MKINKNQITNSVIIGLATLVAAITWAGLKGVLFNDGSWIFPSIGFLILSVFLSLNWLLTKSRTIILTTLVFILITFLLTFGLKIEFFAVLLLALLFFVFGSFRSISEKEDRIKINSIKIVKRGLPYIMTGLSLVIASAYYFSPLSMIGQEKIEIPRPFFNTIISPVIEVFEGQTGFDLRETRDTLYQTINGEINKRSEPYKGFIPISLSVGVFFALKVISIPFIWLTILLASLIFKILVWTKAIHIHEKSVLREVIEI